MMWTSVVNMRADNDQEEILRADLRNQAGQALQLILSWLLIQAEYEATWTTVPWWAKRAPQEIDQWLISTMKTKPSEGSLYRVETIAGSIESASRALANGPDLAPLRTSLNTYMEYRRKHG